MKENKEYKILYSTIEEFGAIAKKVNQSSRERKEHTQGAMKNIDLSLKAGAEILKELQSIAKANVLSRNRYNIVQNTFVILNSNLGKQKSIIDDIKKKTNQFEQTGEAFLTIETLLDSLKNGLGIVGNIINTTNEVILVDNLIIMLKKSQKKRYDQLKKLTLRGLGEAQKAIEGSQSNLERGARLSKKFMNIERLVKNKKRNELQKLAKDTRTGWKNAVKVNRSSNSQWEFAEMVNLFTKQLHEDSLKIKDMVIMKHLLFKSILLPISEMTVLISIEIKEYLNMKELIGNIKIDDKSIPEDVKNLLNDLSAYINIACRDIGRIAGINLDMSDSINLNARVEHKTVELTQQEIEYCHNVRSETESTTEATKYPIEGSARNIKNGRILENFLKDIIAGMKK